MVWLSVVLVCVFLLSSASGGLSLQVAFADEVSVSGGGSSLVPSSVNLVMDSQVVPKGNHFDVQIIANDLGLDLTGIKMCIAYDQTKMSFDSVTYNGIFAEWGSSPDDGKVVDNKICLEKFSILEATVDDACVATLHFTANELGEMLPIQFMDVEETPNGVVLTNNDEPDGILQSEYLIGTPLNVTIIDGYMIDCALDVDVENDDLAGIEGALYDFDDETGKYVMNGPVLETTDTTGAMGLLVPAPGDYMLGFYKPGYLLEIKEVDVQDNNVVIPDTIELIKGDVNNDQMIDFYDITNAISKYGFCTNDEVYDAVLDVNMNGSVDFFDITNIIAKYNKKTGYTGAFNHAPVAKEVEGLTLTVGKREELYNPSVLATDEDDDTLLLSHSVSSQPDVASTQLTDGYNLLITPLSEGTAQISVDVSDGIETITVTFTVTVVGDDLIPIGEYHSEPIPTVFATPLVRPDLYADEVVLSFGDNYCGYTKVFTFAENIDIEKFLGYRVSAWVNDEGQIVKIESEEREENIIHDRIEEIEGIDGAIGNIVIGLENADKEYELTDFCDIYYNYNHYWDLYAFAMDVCSFGDINMAMRNAKVDVILDHGEVRFLNILDTDAAVGIVEDVNMESEYIKLSNYCKINFEDRNNYKIFKDGHIISLEDIQSGDIINVFDVDDPLQGLGCSISDDDYLIIYVTSGKTVTGNIEKGVFKNKAVYLTINGVEYKAVPDAEYQYGSEPAFDICYGGNGFDTDVIQQDVTAYLDMNGDIRWITAEGEPESGIYGIVESAYYDAFDDEVTFKIYTTADDVFNYVVDVEDANDLYDLIDSDGFHMFNCDFNLEGEVAEVLQNTIVGDFVTIKLDEYGELDSVEVLAAMDPNLLALVPPVLLDPNVMDIPVFINTDKDNNRVGKYSVNEVTQFFALSQDGNWDYLNWSEIGDDIDIMRSIVLTTQDGSVAKAIIILESGGAICGDKYAVVSDVYAGADGDAYITLFTEDGECVDYNAEDTIIHNIMNEYIYGETVDVLRSSLRKELVWYTLDDGDLDEMKCLMPAAIGNVDRIDGNIVGLNRFADVIADTYKGFPVLDPNLDRAYMDDDTVIFDISDGVDYAKLVSDVSELSDIMILCIDAATSDYAEYIVICDPDDADDDFTYEGIAVPVADLLTDISQDVVMDLNDGVQTIPVTQLAREDAENQLILSEPVSDNSGIVDVTLDSNSLQIIPQAAGHTTVSVNVSNGTDTIEVAFSVTVNDDNTLIGLPIYGMVESVNYDAFDDEVSFKIFTNLGDTIKYVCDVEDAADLDDLINDNGLYDYNMIDFNDNMNVIDELNNTIMNDFVEVKLSSEGVLRELNVLVMMGCDNSDPVAMNSDVNVHNNMMEIDKDHNRMGLYNITEDTKIFQCDWDKWNYIDWVDVADDVGIFKSIVLTKHNSFDAEVFIVLESDCSLMADKYAVVSDVYAGSGGDLYITLFTEDGECIDYNADDAEIRDAQGVYISNDDISMARSQLRKRLVKYTLYDGELDVIESVMQMNMGEVDEVNGQIFTLDDGMSRYVDSDTIIIDISNGPDEAELVENVVSGDIVNVYNSGGVGVDYAEYIIIIDPDDF